MSIVDETSLELSTTGADLSTTDAPICAKEGCAATIPVKGEPGYHRMRKYCDEHQPKQSPGAAKRRAMTNENEPAPTRVVNNNFTIKPQATKKATGPELAVEEAAAAMMGLVPMLLAAFGDEVCPEAMKSAIPEIAHQLAVLAKFHPAIKKIFTTGESTGEFMAWLGLVIVVSPVIVTVLAHHNLVSGKLAERIAFVASMGGIVAQAAAGGAE